MTAIFGYFTGPQTPVFWPGAPFLLSAVIMLGALILFLARPGRVASAEAR
jgi:DHA1 family tetracycline resistance protein-like MFS transporter